MTFSTCTRMTPPRSVHPAVKNWPANGPNFPPVLSNVTPLIDFAQAYGTQTVVLPRGFVVCCFCSGLGKP